jgi:hypothetical protein
VLLLGSTPAAGAEVSESVRERWTFLLQHLVHENAPAAAALIDELKLFKTEHGLRDLFPEAELIHAMGMQARGSTDGLGARAYFELARDLAPDLPGPKFQLGLLDLVEADSGAHLLEGARGLLEGARTLARNPECALRSGIEAVFFALILLLGVTALLASFLFLKYVRLVTHVLSSRLGDRIPAPALLLPVANVVLLPFLLWGSLLLSAVVTLGTALVVGTKRERRWSIGVLVLIGLTPGVLHLLRLTLVLPDLPAVRLYRCELGVCSPDALDRLERTEGVSRPWLLKVRGDYMSRSFRGDPYIFESARDAYTTALKADDHDPALWVNFGNLLVAGRRYAPDRVGDETLGQAVMLYDRALQVLGADARVLSNKSYALDALGDSEGSVRLAEQARAVDASALREKDSALGLASDRPRSFNHNRDLFVFVSSPARVYREMLRTSTASAPRVDNLLLGTLGTAGFLGAWGAIFAGCASLAVALRRKQRRSHYCPSCGDVVVPSASGPAISSDVCSTCFYQVVKGTYMEPREAVLLEIRQRRRHRRRAAGAVLANLVVPGLGLLLRERVAAGLLVGAAFLALALLVFGRPAWLAEPVLWPAGEVPAVRLVLLGVLLATYVLAQLLLLRKPPRRGGLTLGAHPGSPVPAAARASVAPRPTEASRGAPGPTSALDDDDRALTLDADVPRSKQEEDDRKFLEDA